MHEPTLKFLKPGGGIHEMAVHGSIVGQTVQFYQEKGFVLVSEPARPEPEAPVSEPAPPEPVRRKR